jgi:hypothetical protein
VPANLEESLLAVVIHTIQTLGEVVEAAIVQKDQVATFDFAVGGVAAAAAAAAVGLEGRLVHLS